jgi:hypothetical protein
MKIMIFIIALVSVLPAMASAEMKMQNSNTSPTMVPEHVMQNTNPSPEPVPKHVMSNTNPSPSGQGGESGSVKGKVPVDIQHLKK